MDTVPEKSATSRRALVIALKVAKGLAIVSVGTG